MSAKEAKPVVYQSNGEEVTLTPNAVRQFIAEGQNITDKEIVMFLSLCKYQHLNPFLNEAYLVKFGDKAQIITSKEAFMKRAENNSQYDGLEAGCIVERDGEIINTKGALISKKDKLLGAWCKVYRKDRKVPTYVELSVNEFGKNQSTWKKMPANMIRKTAIVNALREAFPNDLGGLYTEEDSGTNNQNGMNAKVDVTPAEPAQTVDDLIGGTEDNADNNRKEDRAEQADNEQQSESVEQELFREEPPF